LLKYLVFGGHCVTLPDPVIAVGLALLLLILDKH